MSYSSEVLALSPVVYFRLGETSGTTAADSSGNGRNGTYVNAPTLGVPGALDGDSNTAAKFLRASSQMVTFPTTGLPSGASPYTLLIWVKPDLIDASQGLMSIGTLGAGNSSNALRLGGSTGAPQVVNYWWGNDLAVNVPASLIAVGQWSMIAATWDGTRRRIYVNGQDVGGDSPSAPNVIPASPMVGRTAAGEFFSGSLDEAMVLSTALTPAQMTTLWAVGRNFPAPLMATPPHAWFKADAITGVADAATVSAWTDSSGNGNHGAQATSSAQPTFKTGISATGLPVLRFDGGDYLSSPARSGDYFQTLFAVVRATVNAGNQSIRGGAGGTIQYRLNNGRPQFVRQGQADLGIATTAQSTSALQVVAARLDAGFAFDQPVASHSSSDSTYNLIDGRTDNNWEPSGSGDKWFYVRPRTSLTATSYTITPRNGWPDRAPKDFKLQGSNNATTWTDLDTRAGVTTWSGSTPLTFTFSNTTAYTYYRLYITAVNGSSILNLSDFTINALAPAPTVKFWIGSSADGSSSWSGLPSPGATTIGANNNPAEFLTGDLGELIVVTSAMTDAQVLDTIAYLNDKWLGGTPATTGVVSAVASAPSLSVAGVAVTSGQVSASAAAPTVAVAGVLPTTGVVAASAPSPSLAVTGDVAGVVAGVVAAQASSPSLNVAGAVTQPVTGLVSATAPAPSVSVTDNTLGATLEVGVTVEVGPLTLLNLVTLPGVEVPVGVGLDTGDATPVVPLPGVTVAVGMSLDARPVELRITDPRHKRTQWRYVVTDLANTPLGELVDIQHDPVADGINTPTTMRFTMAADDPTRALIEASEPLTRKCQVWAGNQLLLWGPILPDQQSDATTAGYTVHDPSWWWRGGRRVIGRLPRKNLLKNGDFRQDLTYWERGFDADSIPKAKPAVRVVTEDFLNDTDGLDPIRAAEITGVESVTQAELSSNAVFWPNLATFRPGGKAAIEAVANAMPTTTGLKVSVVGHTANDGTGNGLGLSARRAAAAKAVILTKRPHAVITTKGVGFYDPKPGFPIDSQEQRRVVISYDQTISGKSKQWMRQTIEVTQPKSARYGLELTAAAMLKVADDWSVEDANMMSVRLVARRKSTPKKIWDESSASISDTDPVGRWIGQSTSVTIPADDRAYLVDVYLYAPAALADYTAVGLFPEEELFFWGQDQALIFKGIVEHIQDESLGHGDLGIETRTPLTGIKRDRTYPFREHMPADTALEEFGGLNRGMDYDTIMTTDGRVILSTFYPQQGKHTPYVLAQGSNVANASAERSRDVASSIIMQAQDLGSYRAETYAKDKRALGGLLLERVVTAEQGTPLNELSEAARQELSWGRLSTTGYWLDIDPDAIDDVLANTRKGDVVRLILDAPLPVDGLARIVNRERHPDSLRLLVALDQEA